MRALIVTAVADEAEAIGNIADASIAVAGIGRTNAAATTTERIVKHGPFDITISAGIAGALPGGELAAGDIIVSSSCVYVEEGLITPRGFADMEGMGFCLGDFPGNIVPVDEWLIDALAVRFRIAPIATVATCSGTDDAAAEVVRRTQAVAEGMEGAAVVHAARRLHVPAIEIRAISNTTGDRSNQSWDIDKAFQALGPAVREAIELLRAS